MALSLAEDLLFRIQIGGIKWQAIPMDQPTSHHPRPWWGKKPSQLPRVCNPLKLQSSNKFPIGSMYGIYANMTGV